MTIALKGILEHQVGRYLSDHLDQPFLAKALCLTNVGSKDLLGHIPV